MALPQSPEYAKTARELKSEVVVAKVNADKEKELVNRYGVMCFPLSSLLFLGRWSECVSLWS